MQIAIVDLGVGNLRSVKQAVCAVAPNADVLITSEAKCLDNADKIILPGQGAVGSWFSALDERNLRVPVLKALNEKPSLGICVGMQALFDYCAEDGGQKGLGLFAGKVRHFSEFHCIEGDKKCEDRKEVEFEEGKISIPQMGWNQVSQRQDHPLWANINDNCHFYFLHSYCANVEGDQSDVAGVANYHHQYVAAVGRGNVFATQFHPEKSHDDGLQLMANFCRWSGN